MGVCSRVLWTSVIAACGGGHAQVDGPAGDSGVDAPADVPSGPECETAMVCGGVGSGPPVWKWDRPLASTDVMVVIDAAITPNGGVVVVGQVTGDVNLGGTSHTAAGGFDAFVLSLDADGHYRWDRMIASTGDDIAASVAVDTCGNVYVSGGFGGALDFGGGPRSITGLSDGFLVAFAPDGTYRWDVEYAGSSSATGDRATALAIDAGDHLVLAGRFGGDIDLGLGVDAGTPNAATFIAGIDPTTGKAQWNAFLRSTGLIEPLGVAVDVAGRSTVTGRFAGTVDFGGGARTSAGGNDAFAVRLDANHHWTGDVEWGGVMTDQAITAAASGSITAVGGIYRDAATFDGRTLTAIGPFDTIIAGVDEAAGVMWDKQWAGTGAEGVAAIATTSAGDFVAHGAASSGTVNFGGTDRTSVPGTSGCPLVGYSADGTYQWDLYVGGTAAGACVGVGVGAGGCGRIAAVGQYQKTVDFGGGSRTSTGTVDGYVVLLAQ